jgi:NAD(P) transhydrogenase subunit alpha
MIVSVPREILPGERRVALTPDLVPKLTKSGMSVLLESDAGTAAGFPDSEYREQGAIFDASVLSKAEIILKVRPPTAEEIGRVKEGALLIGFLQPWTNESGIKALAERRITAFALELMPRIARAQPMDALSAMSTIAGYKAVLMAANRLPKLFPLLMTAAGTVFPAHVAVLGAGVAGLQAIGTAHRLGAVVEAYDPRPAAKEHIMSMGARFMDIGLMSDGDESASGYAASQSENFYRRQQELMADRLASLDVVITTALTAGRRAPVLITEDMVRRMRPGSVIVDLAAECGGNCTLTQPDQEVIRHEVLILGPLNLPGTVPYHASQMYARNVTAFLTYLLSKGSLELDLDDEMIRGPLVTREGRIISPAERASS